MISRRRPPIGWKDKILNVPTKYVPNSFKHNYFGPAKKKIMDIEIEDDEKQHKTKAD